MNFTNLEGAAASSDSIDGRDAATGCCFVTQRIFEPYAGCCQVVVIERRDAARLLKWRRSEGGRQHC